MVDVEEHCRKFRESTGVDIRDHDLLVAALTHRGATRNSQLIRDYERLEFLGDAVFSMYMAVIINEMLDASPGVSTAIMGRLKVRKEMADACRRTGMSKFILVDENRNPEVREELQGNERIQCDVFESVLAALYLDRGDKTTRKFVKDVMGPRVMQLVSGDTALSPVEKIDKLIARTYHVRPMHELIKREGAEHKPLFTMRIMAGDREIARGKGRSKKNAVFNASRSYLSSERGKRQCERLGIDFAL